MRRYTPEEQKINRAKLVAALRSGEYKQIKGQLKSGDGFCCLGVACDIFDPTKWRDEDGKLDRELKMYVTDNDYKAGTFLPEEVRQFYGFHLAEGGFRSTEFGDSTALWKLNDSFNYTFEQIADVIENEPSLLE